MRNKGCVGPVEAAPGAELLLDGLTWQLPGPKARRQLGVDVNPPLEPVMGTCGGGTESAVGLGVENAFGAPGTARTTGGNTGGLMFEVKLTCALLSGGNMRGTMAVSGMPSASA